jgi:integrase
VPKVPVLPEPRECVRFLTVGQAQCLLGELPEHFGEMAVFTLETGLRTPNVIGLQWSRVDLERRRVWVVADEAKGGRDIHVSLNDRVVEIIRQWRFQYPTHVFTYLGKPVLRLNQRVWRRAVERARLDDFHWHDLRHTWATWHVQNGTPLHVLQRLGGW